MHPLGVPLYPLCLHTILTPISLPTLLHHHGLPSFVPPLRSASLPVATIEIITPKLTVFFFFLIYLSSNQPVSSLKAETIPIYQQTYILAKTYNLLLGIQY